MNCDQPSLGARTLSETLSQPRCWQECLTDLERSGRLDLVCRDFGSKQEWLFVGCGSSYYVALSAAASWTYLTGQRAKALPASEIILFPDISLIEGTPWQPVLISRSGHTSEVVKAAEYLENGRNVRTLAISCAAKQPLEAASSATIHLEPANDESTVMTRSFTSMLLALQALAAKVGGRQEFSESLSKVPRAAQAALDNMRPRIESFVRSNKFDDYVFLGQGPFFGIASESHLKVKEMSCSSSQCYHTMEFRHGPKATVGRRTLVTFFLSEAAYEEEREVLDEIKELGATTLVVTNTADTRARRAADLLIELNMDVPEYARLSTHVFAGQLLGYYTALRKGFDPDNPRFLTRVVLLAEKS